MRLRLFLLLLLTVTLPGLAQTARLSGTVVNANGQPVAGAIVMLDDSGESVTTGPSGEFTLGNLQAGTDVLSVIAYGFSDKAVPVSITSGATDLGKIVLSADGSAYQESQQEMRADQFALEDEEGNDQTIGVLGGAGDNIFNNAASYDFSACT